MNFETFFLSVITQANHKVRKQFSEPIKSWSWEQARENECDVTHDWGLVLFVIGWKKCAIVFKPIV